MASIQTFFKVLNKHGYPGPDVVDIAQMIGYDLEDFLPDLSDHVGGNLGVLRFAENTMKKLLGLSLTKVFDVTEVCGGPSWVEVKFDDFDYDVDTDPTVIECSARIRRSKIGLTDGTETTLKQMWDEVDMSDMGEYQEFQDEIWNEVIKQIAQQTGFWLVLQ